MNLGISRLIYGHRNPGKDLISNILLFLTIVAKTDWNSDILSWFGHETGSYLSIGDSWTGCMSSNVHFNLDFGIWCFARWCDVLRYILTTLFSFHNWWIRFTDYFFLLAILEQSLSSNIHLNLDFGISCFARWYDVLRYVLTAWSSFDNWGMGFIFTPVSVWLFLFWQWIIDAQ